MSEPSFSFQELREAKKVDLPGPETVAARDGVELSYRRYLPASPQAALLFYHGGGAHNAAGYQYLGSGLETEYHTAVYLPDIRGHGLSGGPRGDAPSPQQVWADVTTLIERIRAEFPRLPLFLGGHSSGVGLTLNYVSQPGHEPVDGYVFLSPQLGIHSETERPSRSAPFALVDIPAFVANARSGGLTHGHEYAVRFNYPASLLASDPGLVGAITVNMSNALTPPAPHGQFANLNRPFGLWIGSEDELFDPEKVLAFAYLAPSVRADSQAGSLLGEKHLSVLVKAHETIGPWITERVNRKNLKEKNPA
jgi:acylglycerol lipase